MRFFCFLSQTVSYLHNSQNYLNGKLKYPTVAMNKMTTMCKGGDYVNSASASASNLVYKLVPISKEEASKLNEKDIISHDYIKVNMQTLLISLCFFRNWNVKRRN